MLIAVKPTILSTSWGVIYELQSYISKETMHTDILQEKMSMSKYHYFL